MILLAINCIGNHVKKFLGVAHLQGARSDVLLRLLKGEELSVDYSPLDRYKEKGLRYYTLPSKIDVSDIKAFMWGTHVDNIMACVDMNGVPVCVTTFRMLSETDQLTFSRDYPRVPELASEQQRLNLIEIDSLLPTHVPRGLVLSDFSRLIKIKNDRAGKLMRSNAILIQTLVPKGWKVYPVPYGTKPANNDDAWSHYDFETERAFMVSSLNSLLSEVV